MDVASHSTLSAALVAAFYAAWHSYCGFHLVGQWRAASIEHRQEAPQSDHGDGRAGSPTEV